MIEKGEELWLMLIIHIISKRNDSANIVLLCTAHDKVSLLFNRDLNRGCLVSIFSLRFLGSKFLINPRRQFRVRKFFSCS